LIIRIFDIFFSALALLFLLPLFIPIILLLSFTGEREIFYIQKRVGLNGKMFGLYKFATMLKNSPNIGTGEITVKNDPRVLPIGSFLRKTKINELPQLLNVLKGDMSIIGPRPMVPNTFQKYPLKSQNIINKTRPGLSGVGSIIFRDEEKYLEGKENPVEFYENQIIPYKSEVEIWFTKNQSVFLYFKIIFLTIFIVFFPNRILPRNAFKNLPPIPKSMKEL
jgi:lipopolysaccharide/colanic/teichoic acid biosynthesis glycosyltransferase